MRILLGYGIRPGRVLLTAFGVIFVSASLYGLFGGPSTIDAGGDMEIAGLECAGPLGVVSIRGPENHGAGNNAEPLSTEGSISGMTQERARQWHGEAELLCDGKMVTRPGRFGWRDAVYFSVITFTTIGYGDYAPRGWLRIFAATEGLLGLLLMSIFTVSFARKLIR